MQRVPNGQILVDNYLSNIRLHIYFFGIPQSGNWLYWQQNGKISAKGQTKMQKDGDCITGKMAALKTEKNFPRRIAAPDEHR